MRKTLYVLNVEGYAPQITALTYPLLRYYADRIGAEFFGQLPIHGETRPTTGQMYLGPSVAWSRGPFWITFGSLFGLTGDSSRYYPRLLWGIAL